MEITQTDTAASSPAPPPTFEIPSDPAANAEWRKSGEIPAATKTPKAASTPAKETASAEPSIDDAAETAAASATAVKAGEKAKQQSAAANRLNELLADLKKAGLSPEELKSFKREAQQADITPPATSEKTVNVAAVAPVKPKRPDFDTWEKYEEARDSYVEEFAKFTANQAVLTDRQQRAAEAQQLTLKQKVTEATARYGDQTEATIGAAVSSIIGDKTISPAVRQMLDESPVVVDVMYVLGSKPEELASFVALAKSNPGAAIRKIVVLEQLVEQELAKGTKASTEVAAAAADTGERDAQGKFVSQTAPAKEKTKTAPPPPEELNTRRSAPTDPIEAAVKNNDFANFKAEEDRRDLARRRGA